MNQRSEGRRFSVSVTPREELALDVAIRLTGAKQNDVVGRAIQMYAFLLQIMYAGDDVLIRLRGERELQRLHPIVMPVCSHDTPDGPCVLPAGHEIAGVAGHLGNATTVDIRETRPNTPRP